MLSASAQRVGYIPNVATFDIMAHRVAYCVDMGEVQAGFHQPEPLGTLQLEGKNAASLLAAELRTVFSAGQAEPLFQLYRWPGQLGIFLFSIDDASIAGACCVFRGTACLFVSPSELEDILYVHARGIADLLRLRARRNQADAIVLYQPSPSLYRVKGTASQFSDAFALELLVPEYGLGIALRKVRDLLRVTSPTIGDVELLYLSRIFGVSFFAMARRCELLELLPPQGATAMLEFIEENFGGAEARAAELGLPPRPEVHFNVAPRTVIHRMAQQIGDGLVSIAELSAAFAIPQQLLALASSGISSPSNRFWQ